MPIVAMAVRFVAGNDSAQSAFFCGDPFFNDDFDGAVEEEGRLLFVPVENLTFGPAKTFLERYHARAFIADGARWQAARVLASLPKFAKMVDRMTVEEALDAHQEYRALHHTPDSALARLHFLDALACHHLEAVHKEVLRFGRGKGISLEDPVFAADAASEDALRELTASGAATRDDYFAARMALLEHVPRANPRLSKLAFGRLAWSLRPGTA
jgi:hypothetical protein